MIDAIRMPRLSSNDDEAKVVAVLAQAGQAVREGQALFEIETAKAVGEIVAERSGFLLKVMVEKGERVSVRSVLAWVGDHPDDRVPEPTSVKETAAGSTAPTLQAQQLLERHGLRSFEIRASGRRLTAADVRAHLEGGTRTSQERASLEGLPPGRQLPLSTFQRGMASMVDWSRNQPVATYLERIVDQAPWEDRARRFQQEHDLLLDPLLGLLAHRLVRIVRELPLINATFHDDGLYEYDAVNLGFTIDVKSQLYLAVIRDADRLCATEFIEQLGELQRRAFRKRLRTDETTGATLGFSSLAKGEISRHVPVLPPHTSLIVAHSAALPLVGDSTMTKPVVLGATYDHRVLDGALISRVLARMSTPGDP
jgi:pyruvate/2-oxoglutarate dehydrogenase complex dihydrolipoamide acyltransferase (E2) component